MILRAVRDTTHRDIMHIGRKLFVVVIVLTILWGAILASDPRFISGSEVLRNPFLLVFLYGPTIIFAIISASKWRHGQIWPMAAFAIGLLCTGLFHKIVAGAAYGNPGYMIPAGHIAAPAVSLAAYLIAFLSSWAVVRVAQSLHRRNTRDEQKDN